MLVTQKCQDLFLISCDKTDLSFSPSQIDGLLGPQAVTSTSNPLQAINIYYLKYQALQNCTVHSAWKFLSRFLKLPCWKLNNIIVTLGLFWNSEATFINSNLTSTLPIWALANLIDMQHRSFFLRADSVQNDSNQISFQSTCLDQFRISDWLFQLDAGAML